MEKENLNFAQVVAMLLIFRGDNFVWPIRAMFRLQTVQGKVQRGNPAPVCNITVSRAELAVHKEYQRNGKDITVK